MNVSKMNLRSKFSGFSQFLLVVALAATPLVQTSCAKPVPDEIARKSVDELRQMMQDSEGRIRAQAVLALGLKGSAAKPAIPDMIKLLGDEKAFVRNRAMESLSKLGKDSLSPLIDAVENSRDRAVRFYAANALKKMPDPKAQKAYTEFIAKEGDSFGLK